MIKTGEIVKVKVLEVNLGRKRIALTMRLDEQPGETQSRRSAAPEKASPKPARQPSRQSSTQNNSAMGDALAAAFKKK